jgi:photosystem II stability/assembly factor-like uncharacterized protein
VRKTIDGGATWTGVSLTSEFLRYVYFYNTSLGFIVGTNGLILRTANGGATWSPATTGTTQQFSAVFFTSSSTGYASGFNGMIMGSVDGGMSWTALTSGTTTPLGINQFPTATTGIVIGDNGLIRQTLNSGVSWSPVTSGTTTDNLTGLDFIDNAHAFIVGGNVGTNVGCILETTNAGSSWTYMLPGTSRLTRVTFYNANTGYAVGLDGTILKYTSNVGIEEQNAVYSQLQVFPNPAKSVVNIDLRNNLFMENARISLYDISGRLIKTENVVSREVKSLDVNGIRGGTYILKLEEGNQVVGETRVVIK